MPNRGRQKGPQQHAEGQHGEKTHRRFTEQLHESAPREERVRDLRADGAHRLHQSREQHDEAEKNSEKVEAQRELDRGRVDENVLGNARTPRGADGR